MIVKNLETSLCRALLGGLILFCSVGAFGCLCAVQAQPFHTYHMRLTANVVNRSPHFIKYLYSFPLNGPATFSGLTGNVSIEASGGPGLAEALFSLYDIPIGQVCPKNGVHFLTHGEVHAHFPKLIHIASFIVKVANSPGKITIPTNFTFPDGIPVSGCLVAVLDGGGLQQGITFNMSSRMVAALDGGYPSRLGTQIVGLDEEFCFGTGRGCHRHTMESTSQAAWMHISKIKTGGMLLLLYGDIGDSTWRQAPTDPIAVGLWDIEQAYYLIPGCNLVAIPQVRPDANGNLGPSDFFHQMPPGSHKLYDVVMNGHGQAALHAVVNKIFKNLRVQAGDCLVFLVHVLHPPGPSRAIDAESQVYAEIGPP